MRATRAIAVLHDDDHSSTDHDIAINASTFLLHLISTIKKPIVVNLKINFVIDEALCSRCFVVRYG